MYDGRRAENWKRIERRTSEGWAGQMREHTSTWREGCSGSVRVEWRGSNGKEISRRLGWACMLGRREKRYVSPAFTT